MYTGITLHYMYVYYCTLYITTTTIIIIGCVFMSFFCCIIEQLQAVKNDSEVVSNCPEIKSPATGVAGSLVPRPSHRTRKRGSRKTGTLPVFSAKILAAPIRLLRGSHVTYMSHD